MFASLKRIRLRSRYYNYVKRKKNKHKDWGRLGREAIHKYYTTHPMKLLLNAVLAFPLVLALAVSAQTGGGKGPAIGAGSGNTRTDQRIALAALDPVVDAMRPCVYRGSYCDPQVPCCARYQYWYGNVSGRI